jgi:predicted membrane channel-forming protein YqfA (hemolysin III family)
LIGALIGCLAFLFKFIKNEKAQSILKFFFCISVALAILFGFDQFVYLKKCINVSCLAFGYVCK